MRGTMPTAILKDKGQITPPSAIRMKLQAVIPGLKDTSVDQTPVKEKKDLSRWIGAKPGVFQTTQEVDQFIRAQRDAWN